VTTHRSLSLPAAVLFVAALLVYGPGAGQGFVKDDFTWVRRAQQVVDAGDWSPLVRRGDFFRPVVTASFAANYAVCGTAPLCYGWTNLALAMVAAALLWAVAMALGLQSGVGLAAAALWFFNWHGINMAVLWVSGRTSLLLIVFSLAALRSLARGQWVGVMVCTLFALGSKEEAVLLPAMLTAVAWVHRARVPWPGLARLSWVFGAPLAVYGVSRVLSGALTPANAPEYYRFTFAPAAVLRNVMEYADRSVTVVAVVLLVAWLLTRRGVLLEPVERATVRAGAIWLTLGFALTVWLPVRSSLYACFPSLGSALAGAAVLGALWRNLPGAARRPALVAACVAPLVLLPVYSMRNSRLVGQGALASQASAAFAAAAVAVPDDGVVWVTDDRSARITLDGAFGSAIDDAAALAIGRGVRIWVDPPLTDFAAAGIAPPAAPPAARLALREGRVQIVP
jgi:hypothetical protein